MLHIADRDVYTADATTRVLASCVNRFVGLRPPMASCKDCIGYAIPILQLLRIASVFCNTPAACWTMLNMCFGARRTRTQN